jgi:hypothetical protein
MLKISSLKSDQDHLELKASIKTQDDAVRLQKIFNSLVADQFCIELGFGFEFDMERGEGGYYPALDYPKNHFFKLSYDNREGKVYFSRPKKN